MKRTESELSEFKSLLVLGELGLPDPMHLLSEKENNFFPGGNFSHLVDYANFFLKVLRNFNILNYLQNIYLFICLKIILKERERAPSTCRLYNGWHCTRKKRKQELSPCLLCEWPGPMHSFHLLLFSQMH